MRIRFLAALAMFAFAAFAPVPQGPCNNTGNVTSTPASRTCTPDTKFCARQPDGTLVVPCGRVCIDTPASGRCDNTVFLAKHCCYNATAPIKKTTYKCVGTACEGEESDEGLVTFGKLERCTLAQGSTTEWLNTAACDAGSRP